MTPRSAALTRSGLGRVRGRRVRTGDIVGLFGAVLCHRETCQRGRYSELRLTVSPLAKEVSFFHDTAIISGMELESGVLASFIDRSRLQGKAATVYIDNNDASGALINADST